MRSLIVASLRHYKGIHLLVVAGVAIAVAVLAGALLVGSSVRASLRDLALDRLGLTGFVVSSSAFFREAFADDIAASDSSLGPVAPIVALVGAVSHEDSRRTAARVQVFGVDDRFMRFHAVAGAGPASREAWLSPALAAELGGRPGDSLLLRVARPTDIPLSTLQGRRDDVSERIRLSAARVLDRRVLGEFSLVPAQGPALSIFVPLSRLQQDLDLDARVNAVLVRVTNVYDTERELARLQAAVSRAARIDDLGLHVRAGRNAEVALLESRTGLIKSNVADAAAREASRSGLATVGALSYLANAIRAGDREIPYSVITAIDLEAYDALSSPQPPRPREVLIGAGGRAAAAPLPPLRLNAWAAEDLGVAIGDRIDVDYFLWSDEAGLQTASAAFVYAGVVPMSGAGGDATLTPEYPGITDAGDVTSWDPPFPVDMKKVRPQDEAYWDQWRTAPKAFIPLEVGQRLWPSPFGTLSSLRTVRGDGAWPAVSALDLFTSGVTIRPARAEALAAADGTTDFGEYFVYFSFFLVISGLLLAGLFFALSVEQRAKELGLLVAVGFAPRDLQRVLIGEAAVLAMGGTLFGVAGAVAYAALIMYGLRTWWVDAVGTTALQLHLDALMLGIGAAAALAAALMALVLSFRRIGQRSARTLLTAGLAEITAGAEAAPRRATRAAMAAYLSIALAVFLIVAAGAGRIAQVAAFFAAGGLLLLGGFAAFSAWLRMPAHGSSDDRGLLAFGAHYARWRPSRSVLSVALIAFACFVLVSVGAFRRDPAGTSIARDAGTGGFALMAEAAAPLMHNPNLAAGRAELGLDDEALARATIARFRLRPGDEASCLTLYRPTNPRIVAPEPTLLSDGRFAFARSLAETDAERANPWLLLNRTFADGAVPAIADQTSLTYVFHLQVGDDFVFTPEGGAPIRLRMVAALADSVLQSEVVISEPQFIRLFPRLEGYRVWMIEAPEENLAAITTTLEDRLSDFGVDVVDTRARLAAYHQVENTYLSTFQALGALGLLVGTLGLAAVLARNVLERRRELGLLGAIGFTRAHLRAIITAESLMLVGTGLALGTVAALVAVAPALMERADSMPWGSLLGLVAAVTATGLLSSFAALRVAASVPVVEAVKSE